MDSSVATYRKAAEGHSDTEAALGSESRFRVLDHYSVEFLQIFPAFWHRCGVVGDRRCLLLLIAAGA
jgi:hypothetical protein